MSPDRENPVYLDHAADTPMVPEALAAMAQASARPGNAASLHGSGRRARRILEESRESIARDLGARPSEVVFTGGGTESVNLAVKGIFWARREADPAATTVIASAVEHHAVLDAVNWLGEHEGATVVLLPVDALGRVDPADLRAALDEAAGTVALVTVMWANNEVGTLEPIADLVAECARDGVPLHSDATQAAGHVPVDFDGSGLAALTVAAHKFGGPQGVGALLIGRNVACVPMAHGGGHERDLRSGTPNVAGAAGMAAALTVATARMDEESARRAALRDRLIEGVRGIEGAVVNGGAGHGAPALPGIAHVSFVGCEGDSLLMLLDARGIEAATGSACSAGVARPSHVLEAMGTAPDAARGSLRFSFGPESTEADVDTVLDALGQVVERARAAGLASSGAR
ncbi:cysteine desulfurase family protein [Tsukamurella strandjordii]|uniref:Cysteine desulfurase family protein n=2 Tax=Tsukamurella strandjordii TaxID=147577 RepID=A0AA90NIN9_9ACTN|nr:cysteine desulfurase family protein [Tsukamurella strandjordii]MDP0399101.1 cysteine desulfurase family protein [Tsukamurella strandjordii]